MTRDFVISIDQSTQGTKALLFDKTGNLCARKDLPHRQIVNDLGWVSHDPEEIYSNTVEVVRRLLKETGTDPERVAALGISNQRETSLIWDKETGKPIADAIVWQCARTKDVCARVEQTGGAQLIRQRTGIPLSPYFPASKLAWLLENVDGARKKAECHELCFGTIDTWLVYKMTDGSAYKTDVSNASRTQLFNIFNMEWDREICALFGIDADDLAKVCDSDSLFGETTLGGVFPTPVPVLSVLGDSHAALFGQGCLTKGSVKCTYGTGSSVMMNIGEKPVRSTHGLITSLAWRLGGRTEYVLEGNINYTGAVISWLKDDVRLIESAGETERFGNAAHQDDKLYFVPAFSGLGAPYWDSEATGILTGITRTTGKNEIVRACLECIAYQITDVATAMGQDAGLAVTELRADGGPTRNGYLMQFQSDILRADILVPEAEELSGIGAAYAAGLSVGLYDEASVFELIRRNAHKPAMPQETAQRKYEGWKNAVKRTLTQKQ